ncbi:MAG TPA: polyphenol oxidase family protein [Gaiellaceae bacterium]|nr:polyphenol oxidase family protein [Gaiellaceae bacterium]
MIRWEAPGPYVVAFTTREGGVSKGEFASLNLGSRYDDQARVTQNRRIACERLGLDASRLVVNRQRHTARANRARAGAEEIGDALWTDDPGVPILALAADCVPIAIATAEGRPALAVVHAGWRGLAAGVVEAGVAALGPAPTDAIVGPSIGPCCYEVGPEVSERFDDDVSRDGTLDLWTAAERALLGAGVRSVERVDLCTRCNPGTFFSHRRTGPRRGAQGVIGAVA